MPPIFLLKEKTIKFTISFSTKCIYGSFTICWAKFNCWQSFAYGEPSKFTIITGSTFFKIHSYLVSLYFQTCELFLKLNLYKIPLHIGQWCFNIVGILSVFWNNSSSSYVHLGLLHLKLIILILLPIYKVVVLVSEVIFLLSFLSLLFLEHHIQYIYLRFD